MSNTITIELCQEDRKRLDEIVGFLGRISTELKSRGMNEAPTETPTAAQSAPEAAPVETEHPVDEVSPHGIPAPAAEPERPAYTLDDIQALVIKLAAPGTGKKDKTRAIIKEYAERVGLIQEKDFDAVMGKLTALDKEG